MPKLDRNATNSASGFDSGDWGDCASDDCNAANGAGSGKARDRSIRLRIDRDRADRRGGRNAGDRDIAVRRDRSGSNSTRACQSRDVYICRSNNGNAAHRAGGGDARNRDVSFCINGDGADSTARFKAGRKDIGFRDDSYGANSARCRDAIDVDDKKWGAPGAFAPSRSTPALI